MPSVLLTDRYLQHLTPPSSGRIDVADTKVIGLLLRVTASNHRTWAFRYRMDGSRALHSIVIASAAPGAKLLSLADARLKADALKQGVRQGIDPNAAVHQQQADAARRLADTRAETARLLAEEAARPTLANVCTRWLRHVDVTRAKSTADGYRTSLTRHVLPTLGAMKIADVERKHVAALHEAMQAAPIAANKMLAALSVLMSWAELDGARPANTNPCFGVHRFPETKRQRFLTHDELARVGAALATAETVGLPPSDAMQRKARGMSKARRAALTGKTRGTYKINPDAPPRLVKADVYAVTALRLMLLTGWRLHEVVTTRWADVNLTLRVAHHRTTKTGAVSRPLSLAAVELLTTLPKIDGSPWLFPAARDAEQHIGKPTRLWDAVRVAAGLHSTDKHARVMAHDLRHTVGAMAATAGLSLPVIANMLGHRQVSTTERYSHLHRDARHDAADLVAGEIAAAMQGASTPVTPLRGVEKVSR